MKLYTLLSTVIILFYEHVHVIVAERMVQIIFNNNTSPNATHFCSHFDNKAIDKLLEMNSRRRTLQYVRNKDSGEERHLANALAKQAEILKTLHGEQRPQKVA